MNLREFFEDSGMTQSTLARRAGVSQATISKILRGHDIRLSIAIKISNATKKKVACDELLTDGSDNNRKNSNHEKNTN